MRKIALLLLLCLFLLPSAAFAQEGGEEGTGEAETTETTIPRPALALAAYYELDVATIQSLHQAGIGYGLMFKLLPLVQSGEMTVAEIIAWKSGETQGMGTLIKMARAHLTRGENMGAVMREYARTQREQRRNEQGNGGTGGGPPEHAGRPENAGPPDHAQGNANGRNRNNGQGQGNGRGNGGGKDK